MEMWLRQTTLVFLTAVAATRISGQASVNLDGKQKRVEVPFGSPLDLNCSLDTSGFDRFRVFWYFYPLGSSSNEKGNISVKIIDKFANSTMVSKQKGDGQDLLLSHTSSATKNHSGWYYCEVTEEIPFNKHLTSNKTEVIITKIGEPTTYPSIPIVTDKQAFPEDEDKLWPWILLGVSAFILIVLVILCVLLRRRCCRSRDAEDPIYANTRPLANKQPSPRPGMPVDNLKASSQNLRNPSPGKRYDEGKRRHK
ncbi:uncharacterized protein LOC127350153 isoform X2 [Dicentrarchus labrax]|uniref:uncharacterized protein LOC127350153 isoform X2 n=1 Tax=Dicentrarchus labrax TaxID=13489 RepID=UPI0021F55977|nr:uncharacterized protein LOC127350153 isoform X2 [Dicentrarchus labrax]